MTWTECINPFNKPVHYLDRGITRQSDIAKLCGMCWHKAQVRNGTLPKPDRNAHFKSIDSKPERDSL